MRHILKKVILITIGMTITTALWAKEERTTLIVHHFLSPKSNTHVKFIKPWADKLTKTSGGKIQVQIFPSMSMGGKPNELYKQVRNGTADIIWTLAGYTPGVFPRTEVYELPTVHKGDPLKTTLAIYKNFDLIKEDFKDVIPLVVHVHAGNVIHTTDKRVKNISDMQGLKIRTPSRTGGWLIREMGAEPVGMPLPALPQALSKRAVDGGMFPFEVFPPYKFHQLTRYSSYGQNRERFGTSIFLFLMNKDKFNSLSKELQNIIVQHTQLSQWQAVGKTWIGVEKPGIEMQRNSDNSEVVRISDSDMKAFNQAGQRVVDRWVAEVSQKGIDGKELVRSARKAIKK